jgi:hypothetical protein
MRSAGITLLLLSALCAGAASPESADFPIAVELASLDGTMPKLARFAIEDYHDEDRRTFLDNLFRLHETFGRFDDGTYVYR